MTSPRSDAQRGYCATASLPNYPGVSASGAFSGVENGQA